MVKEWMKWVILVGITMSIESECTNLWTKKMLGSRTQALSFECGKMTNTKNEPKLKQCNCLGGEECRQFEDISPIIVCENIGAREIEKSEFKWECSSVDPRLEIEPLAVVCEEEAEHSCALWLRTEMKKEEEIVVFDCKKSQCTCEGKTCPERVGAVLCRKRKEGDEIDCDVVGDYPEVESYQVSCDKNMKSRCKMDIRTSKKKQVHYDFIAFTAFAAVFIFVFFILFVRSLSEESIRIE